MSHSPSPDQPRLSDQSLADLSAVVGGADPDDPVARAAAIARKQARRRRLVLLSMFVSAVNALLLALFVVAGWARPVVAIGYVSYCVISSIAFYVVIERGWNLRSSDPTMSMALVIVANAGGIVAMYFMENTTARALYSMVGLVAMTYGGMNTTRARLLIAMCWTSFACITLFVAQWLLRAPVMDMKAELLLLFTQLAVLSQIALYGSQLLVMRQQLQQHSRLLDRAINRLMHSHAELNRDLGAVRRQASHDDLSGLLNRRHVLEALQTEVARSERYSLPLAVALLDIDHFKVINDTWGHDVGDLVIRRFAYSLSDRVRSIDSLGRYGGEEFLLVMSSTALGEAELLSERLRQFVATLAFPEVGESLRITISIGVAQWHPGEQPDAMIRRADRALYEAKGRGRNQVVISRDERMGVRLPV